MMPFDHTFSPDPDVDWCQVCGETRNEHPARHRNDGQSCVACGTRPRHPGEHVCRVCMEGIGPWE